MVLTEPSPVNRTSPIPLKERASPDTVPSEVDTPYAGREIWSHSGISSTEAPSTALPSKSSVEDQTSCPVACAGSTVRETSTTSSPFE